MLDALAPAATMALIRRVYMRRNPGKPARQLHPYKTLPQTFAQRRIALPNVSKRALWPQKPPVQAFASSRQHILNEASAHGY